MEDFIKEYFEQDNLGTAFPIYFTIRDVKWVPCAIYDDPDRIIAISDSEQIAAACDFDELARELINTGDYKLPDDFRFDETCFDDEQDMKGMFKGVDFYAETKTFIEKGMFLLSREAKNHLTSNAHHYHKEAHVYCHHAWRAPETEKFLNDCKALINAKKDQ